jgi:hypothetical protein
MVFTPNVSLGWSRPSIEIEKIRSNAMAVLTLPQSSRAIVFSCLATQILALYVVAQHPHRNLWLCVIAFFAGGFLTDLISGLFHFSFDYVWPPRAPIMGPISVEFRQHHDEPTLDPSAVVSNLTRGAYGALPIAIVAWIVLKTTADNAASFLMVATLMWTSLWMLGFHQIHSYAHMGSTLSPEEFNQAVVNINRLSSRRQQKEEFARLFETVGIPPVIRRLQRCRLFLRPEVHWRHHISFETDFSSVNGWSDPLMNLLYKPIARRKKVERSAMLASFMPPGTA